ncbi:MAG: caspase family protein [Lewinellaceae bacterium]|nr:caspase family protein [Lewinellaceae bacterium]
MKPLKLLFILLLFAFAQPLDLPAQSTLHLILSIDQYNQDISKGCEIDDVNLTSTLEWLAEDAGMGIQKYTYGFSQQDAYNFFQGFTCGPDDVVVFFYSGHGFRTEDDNVIWPLMYYCVENEAPTGGEGLKSCGVPLDWVHQVLIKKGPRMSITIGNSCNNVPGDDSANKRAQGLKKDKPGQPDGNKMQNLALLTSFSGHIIASGASPGQFAYTNDEDGSYFVNELTNVLLDGMVFAENPTSWASMLKKTRDEVQKKKPDQRPQFLIVAGNKKMYSEGKENYQEEVSYDELGLDMFEVDEEGDDYYDNLELDDFDEDDYAEEWEMEFDEGEMEELALEDLPYILLYAMTLDNGAVSQDELDKAYQSYHDGMGEYGYDPETIDLIFNFAIEDYNEPDPEFFNMSLQDAIQEFIDYVDPDIQKDILTVIQNASDNPGAQGLQEFIQSLNN